MDLFVKPEYAGIEVHVDPRPFLLGKDYRSQ